MMLICALLFVQFGIAQRTMIAGWSFPSGPGTVNTYSADCGEGNIYLDGSYGSDLWSIGGTSYSNQATFSATGFTPTTPVCNDETSGKCMGLAGPDNNGRSAVFYIPTTGLQNIQLSYTMRRSSTGYNSMVWSHSLDGTNYTVDTTLSVSSTSTTDYTIDFSNATEINGQEAVYFKLTVDGATGASGNNRYDNILFTGASDVPAAMQPVFSVAAGNFCAPIEVTMTSETENASIYYTTDGTTPDNVNGTLYTGAITISTTTELRAVAYADGLANSFETSATYTFPTEVATISDFKALSDGYYKLTCPVTVVFQSNKYIFVEDEAHTGLCFYQQSGFTSNYINGDVLTDGICGTRSVYQNIIEMNNPEFVNPTATQGTPVEPVAVTMVQLRTNWNTYDSRLVTLSNVTFEQGTVGSGTSSYLKIYQVNDSLGCANTLGTITGFTAPISVANVTGFAINNATLKRVAPRDVNDIVDLLPTLTIVTPTEGQVIEQGNPVRVDLDIENFNFENGSMIEGKLLVNGTAVTTQYLHSAMELAAFENMDLSSMMTAFGEYTIIVSLVDAENQQFSIPATDTVTFTYSAVYIAIETSESSLEFTAQNESHSFTATAFRLDEAITITVDNSNFTVSPATLPATADAETVTVTFTGEASATGTLTLTSGTTVATVALNAVIPIDEQIHSVGFEASEGFTASQSYKNDSPVYFGPDGQQWGTIHGTVTTTDAMVGTQTMQMRYYGSTASSNTHIGHIGYAYTNYDIHNVTKVEFDAKSTGNLKLRASFSRDGGETFEGDSVFNTTASSQRFTYFITDSGEYYSVRVKFAVELPEEAPTSTVRLTIDAVDFYGVTGLEPNIVETPVISEPSGAYLNPINVNITCATEDARIYYTTDGTTPDESSTLYTSPVVISSTCTLKAKAFKGGMDPSNAAFAEYTFPVEVATIADFKTAGANDNTVTYKITGNVTFVYRNGRRIFIEDATGGLLVYDNSNPVVTGTYNEGNIIMGGIIGTHTVYNGMSEMIPSADWAAASGTTTVTPVVTTAADITGDFATYEARLVRIDAGVFTEEASFNTTDYTEATFADATGEIVVRNQFKTLDTIVNAGDSVNVIGLAAIYVTGGTTTYQLFPRTNADIIPIIPTPEDTTTTDPEDTIIGIHTFVPVILTVYPNPTTDNITVSTEHDGGSLELLNAFGQVVYRNTAPVYPMTVDLSSKASGLYFVRVITADNRIAIVKVSKE